MKNIAYICSDKITCKMKKKVTNIGMPVKRECFQPFFRVAVSAGIPMFVFNIKKLWKKEKVSFFIAHLARH